MLQSGLTPSLPSLPSFLPSFSLVTLRSPARGGKRGQKVSAARFLRGLLPSGGFDPPRPTPGGRRGDDGGLRASPTAPAGEGRRWGSAPRPPAQNAGGGPPERLRLPGGEPPALRGERGQREIALPAPLSGLSLGAHRAQVSAPAAVPCAGPQTAPKGSPAKARAFRGAGRTAPLGSHACPGALPRVTRPSAGRRAPASAEASPRVHPRTSVWTTWTLPLRRAAALGFCTPAEHLPEAVPAH